MMGGRTSALAAGVCGALLVGYCIYFDKKRRSDPNFKNGLRERSPQGPSADVSSVVKLSDEAPGRRKQKATKETAGMAKLPDLKDAEAVQKFFLEEIQLGEELLAQGDYEKGVDHLTNAIAVCGQPQQLLQVLQQTLPPPVFQMLLTKLPSISQRIVSAQSLSEDDIE
ncbi:mitochondrial import receptor subunit TOM20 homolog B isoform X2 [Cyclopterus lumpus]|uniref:mitochondrial import receptor subunit TOM20 homolog B isoform X2 n=1 Tax=Cyclopterus lumpus TaxID=8103 RepID=UPI001486394E|nr:mitochondrial import receptor subunit TOM20 homolog B isoform X2 [Cyclopterus lumpus]